MATVNPDPAPAFNTATRLAYERTRVAYERTMMAWVRTGTSLITFGFSVYKFFQLEVADKIVKTTLFGSREFALVLIGLGLLSLSLGALEHRRDMKALRVDYPGMPRSMTSRVAGLIAVLGTLALAVVVLQA